MKIFSCQDYEKQVTLKHEKENQENEKIHINLPGKTEGTLPFVTKRKKAKFLIFK